MDDGKFTTTEPMQASVGEFFTSIRDHARQSGGAALFSDCKRFRYLLMRCWADSGPLMLWIMLNPSVANEFVNDATVERCCRRAQLLGYSGVIVVNLFAFITPYPWVMKEILAAGDLDIVGEANDAAIRQAAKAAEKVVVAWGTDGELGGRSTHVLKLLRELNVTPQCLGTTKDGHPRHPLYVPYSQELEAFA